MVYIVMYDINQTIKDYDSLYAAIKKVCNGDYQHPLESVWLISTDMAVTELYNHIRPELSDRDYLLITKMTNVYYGWLSKNVWDWLRIKL